MTTITISQYMAMPESERPEVRYGNSLVDSICPHGESYAIKHGPFRDLNREGDTLLQVWEAGDVREELIKVQEELASTYYDVYQEYERARRAPVRDWEKEYWQGKEEGMRIALAALNELMPDKHDWEGLQESSNKGRATKLQIFSRQIVNAVEIITDIQEHGIDDSTKREIAYFLQWVENVKRDFGIEYGDG